MITELQGKPAAFRFRVILDYFHYLLKKKLYFVQSKIKNPSFHIHNYKVNHQVYPNTVQYDTLI